MNLGNAQAPLLEKWPVARLTTTTSYAGRLNMLQNVGCGLDTTFKEKNHTLAAYRIKCLMSLFSGGYQSVTLMLGQQYNVPGAACLFLGRLWCLRLAMWQRWNNYTKCVDNTLCVTKCICTGSDGSVGLDSSWFGLCYQWKIEVILSAASDVSMHLTKQQRGLTLKLPSNVLIRQTRHLLSYYSTLPFRTLIFDIVLYYWCL